MPSLIYITRIQPPLAELTQALESSGVHVKSFGPGEITADECVLVMTSEAVLAGLRRPGLGSSGMPPLEAIPKHLGADAAIWNYIKAGKVSESPGAEAKAASQRQASPSMTVPAPYNLGFVASQAGVRALAASQFLPDKKSPQTNNGERASRPSSLAVTPGLQTVRNLADGKSSTRLWKPVVVVAVLSVFAVMLLAGRDPILPSRGVAAVENRVPVGPSVPDAADQGHTASNVRSSSKLSIPAEARQHISDYDFVAEDYTTHFDQRSHQGTTSRAPDLRRGAPNRPVRKRVVID